jgi:DNA polymerase delta subunit 2
LFIGAEDENIGARKRVFNFLHGNCATDAQWHLSRAIRRVIICGGIYGNSRQGEVPPALADVDAVFAELADDVPVDVMPGLSDPSNLNLPQMPIHPYLFRTARKRRNFRLVTNPYEITLDGMQILGHAGQATQDLLQCTSLATPLEALGLCLNAHHLAPTAPDTLPMQPFTKDDPFVIERVPQLLFSAGHKQAEYEWRASSAPGSGTMCVCVPAFNQCPAVVLVNLRNPRDVIVQEFGSETYSTAFAK